MPLMFSSKSGSGIRALLPADFIPTTPPISNPNIALVRITLTFLPLEIYQLLFRILQTLNFDISLSYESFYRNGRWLASSDTTIGKKSNTTWKILLSAIFLNFFFCNLRQYQNVFVPILASVLSK